MKFSKTTGCFYPEDIHYPSLPADLIDVRDDEFKVAMARTNGATLDVVGGKLVIVPAPTPTQAELLVQAQADAQARIVVYAQDKRQLIAGTSDAIEIAGWPNKLRIAQAINAGSATDAEIAAFQAEITARGIQGETLAIFTQKVITNAGFFTQAVALIDGLKRRSQDAVAAAKTVDEVDAVLTAMRAQAEAAFTKLTQSAK